MWTSQGSPLLVNSEKQKKALQEALGEQYVVELGMRYQNPSLESALNKLRLAKVDKIVMIPLYPQYASSSTGSSVAEAIRLLNKWEVTPSFEVISKFYDNPGYIDAFVDVASKYKSENGTWDNYDGIIFSYHGLPERHIQKGDEHYGGGACNLGACCDTITQENQYCYRANCFETTRQLVKKLNIPEGKYVSTFQSRLDDKWIKPYSDKVVEEYAKSGKKKLLMFSAAFVADCLETLYEIGEEYDEMFKEHGGENVTLVESLNDHPTWINALKNMVLERTN